MMKYWLCIIISLLLAGELLADGKFFGHYRMEAPVDIPSQRAVLTYKDNIETLLISSQLDNARGDFGWILPLPALPLTLDKGDQGLLDTLDQVIEPTILKRPDLYVKGAKGMAIVISLWVIVVLLIRVNKYWKLGLSFLLPCLLIVSIMFSRYSRELAMGDTTAATAEVAGVSVHQVKQIDALELAVIEAVDADVLDQWLKANDYQTFTDSERAVIQSYIANKWCFVVGKLKGGDTEVQSPAVKVSFATDKMVYPMSLTCVGGNDIYLKLFVIADKPIEHKLLATDCSWHYQREIIDPNQSHYDYDNSFRYKTEGRGFVAHPASDAYMFDNCWLTMLTGTIEADELSDDIYPLSTKLNKNYTRTYYTQQVFNSYTAKMAYWLWSIGIVVGTIIFGPRLAKTDGPGWHIGLVIIPTLGMAALVPKIYYRNLPVVPDQQLNIQDHFEYNSMREGIGVYKRQWDQFRQSNNSFADMTLAQVQQAFSQYCQQAQANDYYDIIKIKQQDSPNNMLITQGPDGAIVPRFFFSGGYYVDYPPMLSYSLFIEMTKKRQSIFGSRFGPIDSHESILEQLGTDSYVGMLSDLLAIIQDSHNARHAQAREFYITAIGIVSGVEVPLPVGHSVIREYIKLMGQYDKAPFFKTYFECKAKVEAGDIDSVYEIAETYPLRWVGDRERLKRTLLYKLAADYGHSDAMFVMGKIYLYSHDGGRDLELALKYFRDPAYKGNVNAMVCLSKVYWTGKGVLNDQVEAYAWIEVASSLSNMPVIKQKQDKYNAVMTDEQIQQAKERAVELRECLVIPIDDDGDTNSQLPRLQ